MKANIVWSNAWYENVSVRDDKNRMVFFGGIKAFAKEYSQTLADMLMEKKVIESPIYKDQQKIIFPE